MMARKVLGFILNVLQYDEENGRDEKSIGKNAHVATDAPYL